MDSGFTFGGYYRDIKVRRAECLFLFKVDKTEIGKGLRNYSRL